MIAGTNDDSWQSILDSLMVRSSKEGLVTSVALAPTFESKICKIQDSIPIRTKIASWISRCVTENTYSKSGTIAGKLRDEGNAKFLRRNFDSCLKLFTESVICASEYGPELSLAYANRSAVLYHLNHFQEAIQDVELAFKYNYPKNLEYKLLQRKGLCLTKLGRFEDAYSALNEAIEKLDLAKLSSEKKESVLKDMNALRTEVQINRIKEETTTVKDVDLTILREPPKEPETGFSNNSFPFASQQLTLSTVNGMERGVFTQDTTISPGTILFLERPFSMVLLPGSYSNRCHHCTRDFISPVPCLKCTQPRFCTERCRSAAWNQYHKFECTGLDLAHSVGIAHLALRTVLIAGYDRLLSLRSRIRENENEKLVLDGKDRYPEVFNLKDHCQDMNSQDVFQYTLTATLLTTYLRKRTNFFSIEEEEEDNDDTFLYIGGLMLKHICQLVCNASAIFEVIEENDSNTQDNAVYTTSQQRIATAIYPSASMMNHSCDPNVINSFFGDQLIVKAIKEIPGKSEVLNCYGPHFRRHSLKERREVLSAQYHFRCECSACRNDEEFEFQDRFSAFKCPSCDGPVIVGQCRDCGLQKSFVNEEKELYAADELWKRASKMENDASNAIPLLKTCYQIRSKILYAHHRDVTEVINQLAKFYCLLNMFNESRRYLKLCLASISERFGPNSVEYGYELINYVDVIALKRRMSTTKDDDDDDDDDDACVSLRNAARIFELHYGKWNKSYQETIHKLEHLLNL